MMELRDFIENDKSCLQKLANNKNVAKYLTDTFPSPYTNQDAEWWISVGCKNGINKVIELNGSFVGSVGASFGKNERRYSAVVGYWLGEQYWGQGIASKALNLLTEDIFSNTEIVRLSAWVFSPNLASMRVLEKSGFKLEGILNNSIYKNGEFYNEHIYARNQ
jgi:RimJ/RimL family protein N-acetyltransferase